MQKKHNPSPNSFKKTFCVFMEVNLDSLETLELHYKSKSGSSYYYTSEGMFRLSNHWGRLANSKWRLIPLVPNSENKFKLGFATWDSFYPDNPVDNLYYLAVDYVNKTVNYEHKNNPNYNQKWVLRSSSETTKRIRQIRNLFGLTSWARFFEYENLDDLRKIIIEKLVTTNKTLEEIKAEIR